MALEGQRFSRDVKKRSAARAEVCDSLQIRILTEDLHDVSSHCSQVG